MIILRDTGAMRDPLPSQSLICFTNREICQLNNVFAMYPYHSLLFFGARNSMFNSISVSMSQKDSESCGEGI